MRQMLTASMILTALAWIASSPEQARAQAVAFSLAHKLERIQLYSPNAERRERFAAAIEPEVGCAVYPVGSAAEALLFIKV